MRTLDSTWSYRTSFIYSGLKLTLVGFVWRLELQYSLQFKIFIDSVDYEYTYDQTIMNKDWKGRAQYGFTRDTVWQETFKGKDFHKFHGFVAVCESFFPKFGGMASFGTAKASNLQKFSSRKLYFSSIRESFLSWKFPSIWYLRMMTALIHVRSHVTKLTSAEIINCQTASVRICIQLKHQWLGTRAFFGNILGNNGWYLWKRILGWNFLMI